MTWVLSRLGFARFAVDRWHIVCIDRWWTLNVNLQWRQKSSEQCVLYSGFKKQYHKLKQATEAWYEIMKDDHLILYDRSENLVVRTKSSKNWLYKVTKKVENVKCLQLIGSTEASKWHSRLGQVNVQTMKLMANKELVVGLLLGSKTGISKSTSN